MTTGARRPCIGRYRLAERLGSGAQGIVFRASDPVLERDVAVKVLHRHWISRAEAGGRLPRETRAVAALNHPSIATTLDAGRHGAIPYVVFEMVEGASLAMRMQDPEGPTVQRAADWLRQALEGLAHAHGRDVVHGNLRPTNLMVGPDDVLRIMDFGYSTLAGIGAGVGARPGRPAPDFRYLSPEHFSGRHVMAPSDLYCLARIFLDLLGGDDEITAPPSDTPPPLRVAIAPGLRMVLAGALHEDPDSRYPNAEAMLEALDDWVESEHAADPEQATPTALDFLLRRMKRRRDFPALSRSLVEINRLTETGGIASGAKLAKVVVRDYALTNKLLKLANSAMYGARAGAVSNVSGAIRLLGFDQVRMAANGLMLMSHLTDDTSRPELEDALTAAFASGLVARHLARRAGLPDAEDAFICGLFQDLGRTLTIYYFIDEYLEIERLVNEQNVQPVAASRAVLGIGYEDLAVAIGREWRFPEQILHCMRGLEGDEPGPPREAGERLRDFSVFATELCRVAARGARAGSEQALAALAARFAPSFEIEPARCRRILAATLEMLRDYADIIDIDPDRSGFLSAVTAMVEVNDRNF